MRFKWLNIRIIEFSFRSHVDFHEVNHLYFDNGFYFQLISSSKSNTRRLCDTTVTTHGNNSSCSFSLFQPLFCDTEHTEAGTTGLETRSTHCSSSRGYDVDKASHSDCDGLGSEVTERFGGVTSVSNGSEHSEPMTYISTVNRKILSICDNWLIIIFVGQKEWKK